MKVGFVGIGTMGWPMAANVLKAGHDLTVFDLAAGRAAHFVAEHGGGRAAESGHRSPYLSRALRIR